MSVAKNTDQLMEFISGEKLLSGLSLIIGLILSFISINLLRATITDLLAFLTGLGILGMAILCFYSAHRALRIARNHG